MRRDLRLVIGFSSADFFWRRIVDCRRRDCRHFIANRRYVSFAIRVNAVAPGPIWTALQVSDGQPTEELPEFGKATPLGRAGQPAELAPAFVFLACEESRYINGEILGVTGGKLLG